MSNIKILIVEDEGIEALDLQQTLISQGYVAPDIVSTGEDAVKKAEETSPDLVLMDIMLPGEIDGVNAAEQIHARFGIPIIYVTAYTDDDTLQRVKMTDPYGYIVKPFKKKELQTTIAMALYRFSLEKERQQAEEALRESELRYRDLTEKLREADLRKNEFMAVLSHELRNPMATIRNSIGILCQAKPGGDQAKRAIDIIERQIGLLSRLVDDLLDITRITQNKIQFQLQRLELNELVRRTLEDHRLLFDKNGLCLETEYAPSAFYINGDGARLAQVIGNLLLNAAKFTGRGGSIWVSVESDASQKRAVIRVIDTGVGMAPEMLSRLFQPFMQADTTLDRSHGGLGLGLALSKGLIELHGGDVSAFSAGIGKGSEFVVRLPLEDKLPEKPDTLPPDIPHHSRRVLIIEDNIDVAETLRELLELNNHEVAVANNGPEGLSKAREFHPELLLCDIGLPGMSGYDIARTMREDEVLNDIFLVAMTGYALPEDVQRAADAGFERHLAKPVDLAEIDRILAQAPEKDSAE